MRGLASGLALAALLPPGAAWAQACDFSAYAVTSGIAARMRGDALELTWNGDKGVEGRLELAVMAGQPVIRQLALRKSGGRWSVLARDAVPEFHVTTGLRRMSGQQIAPLRALGIPIDQAALDRHRWDPFRDAPLDLSVPERNLRGRYPGDPPPVEGIAGTDQPGLPRKAEEIQRARAEYHVGSCAVRSDGARIEVTYPGVTLGLFEGALRFTVYRGTNLIKQEIVARTSRNWVAYKYDAGVAGLKMGGSARVAWRNTANAWQSHRLGTGQDAAPVPLAAANRLVLAEMRGGSVAAFPPPHRFFWARQLAVNMGYNWYRQDGGGGFAIGIRQSEHEDGTRNQATWALYNARPGTEQSMPVFLYPSLERAPQAAARAMAFTNGDRYRRLPGYRVMNHHYHMDLGKRLLEAGLDARLPDLTALRQLGIDIVSQVDSVMFRDAGEAGEDELAIRAASIEGARRHSDANFLIMASQEVYRSPLGGHSDLLFSHPVYWDMRKPGQPLVEPHPVYGKVYHLADADDLMAMVRAENILITMPHPRTKGSAGFPDAIRDTPYFKDPHFHSIGLRWGMGLDGSERRSCEYRCLPLLDDMSNWMADDTGPLKGAISISEVRHQQPGDDIYGSAPVTYVKLARLPSPDDTRPVIEALLRGDSFWTTGEVLIPRWTVEGTGAAAMVVAEVEWTFPLDFVEIVWGDGERTGRKLVSATSLPPFGKHRFEIPVDLTEKKWIRFAAWDIAAQGAFTQPRRVAP